MELVSKEQIQNQIPAEGNMGLIPPGLWLWTWDPLAQRYQGVLSL
jgi:hypothetical protein